MTNRIPASLNWLIDKRARLDGEVKKTKKSIAKAHALIRELSEIEADLRAIDRALALHDVHIDPENIPPIRSYYVRIDIPYGELTRALLLCLRLKEGLPASTLELADFVAARFANLDATPQDRSRLVNSVRGRLKVLAAENAIVRHHNPEGNLLGWWSIPKPMDG